MTDTELIDTLQTIVDQAGNYRRAGEWLKIDHSHLYRVIHGDKRPGKKLLAALGLRESGRVYG